MNIKIKQIKELKKGDYIKYNNLFMPILNIDNLGIYIHITIGHYNQYSNDIFESKINKEFYCEVLEENE